MTRQIERNGNLRKETRKAGKQQFKRDEEADEDDLVVRYLGLVALRPPSATGKKHLP